jgi:hypothetical protein
MVAQLGKVGNLPPVRGGVSPDCRPFPVRWKLFQMLPDRRPIPCARLSESPAPAAGLVLVPQCPAFAR